MYHCFVEGIDPAAAASSCPSGISGAAFTSLTSLPSLLALVSSEFLGISDQPADDFRKYRIREKEIHAEKRHRHRHHDGGRNHFRAPRPVHLAHFHAHIMQKRAETLRVTAQLLHRLQKRKPAYAMGFFVSIRAYRVGHFTPYLRQSTLQPRCVPCPLHLQQTGRGGGIRTPTLGFGDRWSTVKPTPLNSSLRLEFGARARKRWRRKHPSTPCASDLT